LFNLINNNMTFTDKLNALLSTLTEAPQQDTNTQDAAAPAPAAEQPAPSQQPEQAAIPPEGYVDMVRMLAKALVMNIPTGTIDSLFTTPITKENATTVREGLQSAIRSSETSEDNAIRLGNPSFKKFEQSINENNFMAKYKEILNAMKRFSNDPKLG